MKLFAANEASAQRKYPETKDTFRDEFVIDRDRILYSKEFKRLSGKTQVFVAGFDDHLRTRLTHTLEVAQISQVLAKKLGLNETLCEAIALGHDVGHTPFGHVGERTLNLIMNGCDKIKDFNTTLPEDEKGFKHNWQGMRVVTDLESVSRNHRGLNLTNYTRWGIINHSKLNWSKCTYFIDGKCSIRHTNEVCTNLEGHELTVNFYEKYNQDLQHDSWTLEALAVSWADEIAQRHHDVEDGLLAKIMDKDDLIVKIVNIFRDYLDEKQNKQLETILKETDKQYYLPVLSQFIIDFLITSLINHSNINLETIAKDYNIKSNIDFNRIKSSLKSNYVKAGKSINDIISLSPDLLDKQDQFQDYLFNRILNSHLAQSMDGKSNYIIRHLIKAYLTNPQQLHDTTILTLYQRYWTSDKLKEIESQTFVEQVGILRNQLKKDHFQGNDPRYNCVLLRTVCDFIAGMTDRYALDQYELLYGGTHIR